MAATASYTPDHLSNGYSSTTSAYTNGHHASSMDGRHDEYSHSGLSSPYQQQHQQQLYSAQHSEDSVDATSASQYTTSADVKFNPPATPTSEYGINPSPARPTQFPDYMHRPQYHDGAPRYHHSAAPQAAGAGIPQTTSPSMHTSEEETPIGDVSDALDPSSNTDMHADPSIAAPPSHAYTTHHYTPYAPQQDAPHYPPQHMYPPHQYQYPPHAMPGAYGHVPPAMSQPAPMVSQGPRPPGVSNL